MQKIMFNHKYGLDKAVLYEDKTLTRRSVPQLKTLTGDYHVEKLAYGNGLVFFKVFLPNNGFLDIYPKYQIGEKVAVAESYQQIHEEIKNRYCWGRFKKDIYDNFVKNEESLRPTNGWTNKMFVKPRYMPHHILIKDVRLEKLQDITDSDCLSEGIIERKDVIDINLNPCVRYQVPEHVDFYKTVREAFSVLIDKTSGKGTWKYNPWVFVYEFELVD